MKLLIILLAVVALAEEPKKSEQTFEVSKADAETSKGEVALLRAQLVQLRLESEYGQRVCMQPDLMRARLAAFAAQQQIDAAKREKK